MMLRLTVKVTLADLMPPDAEDATSSALPSFVPANPERRLG